MKLGFALFATIVSCSGADAFTAGVRRAARVRDVSLSEKMSEELGTPCEEECALDSFPNLPPSVHPGVVTGQAMIDLLDHAKTNGETMVAEASKNRGRAVSISHRLGSCLSGAFSFTFLHLTKFYSNTHLVQ